MPPKETVVSLLASKIVISREVFEALPTLSSDDIEGLRRSPSLHKTSIGGRWYAVDQQWALTPIKISAFVREE